MDEEGTLDCISKVWNRRHGVVMKKRKSMLVWDMFRGHLTENVKKTAQKMDTTLAVIPGGLTSLLQPLDVCLNKPFKDRLRKMWIEWMASGDVKTTKADNLMKPHIELVSKWVKDAWDTIPEDIIRRSFLKCSISNSMDGEQDEALFEKADSEVPENEVDDPLPEDSDNEDVYADDVTEEQFRLLFRNSDNESEFEGF